MTGPTDPAAAGVRASHAEREQVVVRLKNAFVHGRLTKDELDARAGRALTARTRGELAALTGDLPVTPDAAPPPSPRRQPPGQVRHRPLARAAAGSGACLAGAFGLVLFAATYLDPHRLGNPDHPWSALCATFAFVLLILALFIAALGAASAAEQRHLRGQLPPSPGAAGD